MLKAFCGFFVIGLVCWQDVDALFEPKAANFLKSICIENGVIDETVAKIMETYEEKVSGECAMEDYIPKNPEESLKAEKLKLFYADYCDRFDAQITCLEEFRKLLYLCMPKKTFERTNKEYIGNFNMMYYLCNKDRNNVIDYIVSRGGIYYTSDIHNISRCVINGSGEKIDTIASKDEAYAMIAKCFAEEKEKTNIL